MKLSATTLSVMKNYSTINSNLLIKPGSELATRSASKSTISVATVEEKFDHEIGIVDLNSFLNTYSLFENPEIELNDNFMIIKDNTKKVKYWYAKASVLSVPEFLINPNGNRPTVQDSFLEFDLPQKTIQDVMKAANVMNLPHIVVELS